MPMYRSNERNLNMIDKLEFNAVLAVFQLINGAIWIQNIWKFLHRLAIVTFSAEFGLEFFFCENLKA